MEYVNATEIPSELLCAACKRPWVQPVMTPCEHVVCTACTQLDTATAVCPECHEPYQTQPPQYSPAPKLLTRLGDKLHVHCIFKRNGCTWTGERLNHAHHTANCEFAAGPKYDFAQPVPEELVCTVCQKPWNDPMSAPCCESIFCRRCVHEKSACPVCSERIDPQIMTRPVRQLIGMRERLPVLCPKKCGWTGVASAVYDHASTCSGPATPPPAAPAPRAPPTAAPPKHVGFAVPAPLPAPPTPPPPRPSGPYVPPPMPYTPPGAFPGTPTALDVPPHFQVMGECIPEVKVVPCGSRATTPMSVLLHLKAPAVPGPAAGYARKPITISAVIDVSGSMRGEKLDLVKKSLHFAISEMAPSDTLGIIAFDNEVREMLPLTQMSGANKRHARQAVSRLAPGGSTALSEGLFAGIDQLRGIRYHRTCAGFGSPGYYYGPSPNSLPPHAVIRGANHALFNADTVKTVWLFTDGQANVGITDPQQLVAATTQKLAQHPVEPTVFTFGFGNSHNATLLRGIGEATQGSYYFIHAARIITQTFGDCLGGLVSIVAQNLVLTVTLPPGVTVTALGTKYPIRSVAPSLAQPSQYEIMMKELYCDEERDILLDLGLTDLAEGSLNLLNWELKYFCVPAMRQVTVGDRLMLHAARAVPPQPRDERVEVQRYRWLTTNALNDARAFADRHNFAKARHCLATVRDTMVRSRVASRPAVSQLVSDVDAAMGLATDTVRWETEGSKRVEQAYWGHAQQRSNDCERSTYANSAKMSFRRRASAYTGGEE